MMKKIFYLSLWLLVPVLMQSQEIVDIFSKIDQQMEIPKPGIEVLLMDSMYIHGFVENSPDSFLMGKEYVAYTEHGQILSDSSLGFFPDSNQWYKASKREFDYDEINRLEYLTIFMSDFFNNLWLEEDRYQHTYIGTSGLKEYTLYSYYDHNAQVWQKKDSTVYTYDAQQNIEFDETFIWYPDSGKYIANEYRHYAYNAQGWCTSDTLFHYEQNDSVISTFLRIYEYDMNGNETEYRSYDGWSGTWMEMEKHEYEYNGLGMRMIDLRYDWDWQQNEWRFIEQGLFSYDDDQNMFLWRYFVVNQSTGILEKDFTAQLFWGLHQVVGVPEFTGDEQIRFWPNPANDMLRISSMQNTVLDIYTIEGRLCLSHKLSKDSNIIAIGHLPPGLYFLRTRDGNTTQKLIIQ